MCTSIFYCVRYVQQLVDDGCTIMRWMLGWKRQSIPKVMKTPPAKQLSTDMRPRWKALSTALTRRSRGSVTPSMASKNSTMAATAFSQLTSSLGSLASPAQPNYASAFLLSRRAECLQDE